MKVIFNCYSCGKATEHELTTSEFQCECGITSSTTLSPNNADIVVLRDLSPHDIQEALIRALDYEGAEELENELSLVIATIWVGFTSGKLKTTNYWGPSVCALLEPTRVQLKQAAQLDLFETHHEELKDKYVERARHIIRAAISLIN